MVPRFEYASPALRHCWKEATSWPAMVSTYAFMLIEGMCEIYLYLYIIHSLGNVNFE